MQSPAKETAFLSSNDRHEHKKKGFPPCTYALFGDIFTLMKNTDTSFTNPMDATTAQPRVTHCMVRARTVELAKIAGRSSMEIRQRDYEQAKRELTGEADFDRQLAVLYPKS